MGLFGGRWFPGTNLQDLNLDWIIRRVKDLSKGIIAPWINPDTFTWMVYDTSMEEFVDSGVSAAGEGVGPQGPPGVGVPAGGTAGQILSKQSNTDFDTGWIDPGGTAEALPLAGGTMAGNINMDGNKVSGLPTPIDNTDAATKAYADTKLPLAGGTMAGDIDMDGKKVSGLPAPVNNNDAATKAYADTKLPLEGGTLRGSLNMGGKTINNLSAPLFLRDAATKEYVDNLEISELAAHNSIIAATAYRIGGNTSPVTIAAGQYVILYQSTISGLSDGAYIAAQTIPANTPLTSAHFTPVGNGGISNNLASQKASIVRSPWGNTLQLSGASQFIVMVGISIFSVAITKPGNDLIVNVARAGDYANAIYSTQPVTVGFESAAPESATVTFTAISLTSLSLTTSANTFMIALY